MHISIESRHLTDVVVLVPDIFTDGRGFFSETFRTDQFELLGLPTEFVQDNHSQSARGVLRGLHFQWDPPMGKLMRVTVGSAFLVAVDIRKGSPTLGKWVGVQCSADNRRMYGVQPALPVVSARCLTAPRFNISVRGFTTVKRKVVFAGTIPESVLSGRLRTQSCLPKTA